MNLIIAALGLFVFAATSVQANPETPSPPIVLELVEPDWTQIGDGNYSPWVVDDDGNSVWNPSKSFNDWLATIPDEDKAWPILVKVYFEHYKLFHNRLLGSIPSQQNEDIDRNGQRDWDQLVTLFADTDMPSIVPLLNTVLSKPYVGEGMHKRPSRTLKQELARYGQEEIIKPSTDPNTNPHIFMCANQSRSMLYNVGKLLVSYSARLVELDRIDEFVGQTTLILDSIALFDERPCITSSITANATQGGVFDVLRWALYEHENRFTDAQLLALDRAIDRNMSSRLTVIEDQLVFHDTIRRMYSYSRFRRSMKRLEGGLSDAKPLNTPYQKLKEPIREVLALFDMPVRHSAIQADTRQLYGDWLDWFENMGSYEELDYPISSVDRELLDLMIPSLGRARVSEVGIRSYCDAMRLVIAIHRHKLRHGQFPESIDTIDKDLLTIVPIDPYTGRRLKYRISQEFGPMVYAVGRDQDDDQGTNNGYVQIHTRISDGDFVYYPDPWVTQEPSEED